MFLDLAHTKIPIYLETRNLVKECYKALKNFLPRNNLPWLNK